MLNQFHVSYRKPTRSLHILFDFKFCTATLTNQTAFVLGWFLFTPKQQKKYFLSVGTVCDLHRHVASVRWRLSSGRWEVIAWHFAQQSCSSFQFSRGYWPKPVESVSHVFHCMWLSTLSPPACDVKVMRCLYQDHTLHNCFQTACSISWSIPGLCAISPNTGLGHLRGAHHLTSQMKNSQVSIILTHCWKSFSHGRNCWTCVGWDGVLISSSASAAFRSQQICNGLIEISCRCGLSSCTTSTHVSFAPWGEYAQQW